MPIPVSLADARRQLRFDADDSSHDEEIAGFIDDAAAWVEAETGHILAARDVTEDFASFGRTTLRAWPVKSTAVPIVTYLDAGTAVAVPGVRIGTGSRPVRIAPGAGFRWPSVPRDTVMTVTVRAGYETADAVPGNFRRAMLVLISAYDADREGGDILAKAEASARRLCRPFRLHRL